MKTRRTIGMTLIEVMVAISVMSIIFGVTYDTIYQCMRFHRHLQNDSLKLMNNCRLAEKLTGDFASLDQLSSDGPDHFLLKLQDNSTVAYDLTNGEITRVENANGQQQRQKYPVGKSTITFWNEQTKIWTPQFDGQSPAMLRLQMAGAELVLSQEPR